MCAQTSTSKNQAKDWRVLLVVAHLGFVLAGIVTTLLGPLLPTLAAKWSLNDATAGRLFTAQFIGSLVGVGLSNYLMRKFDLTRVLTSGFALMMIGVAGVGANAFYGMWSAILIWGIGLGLTTPTINLMVAEANSHRRAAALNILNFAWGVGAMSSAPLIAVFVARHATLLPLLALSLALGVIGCCFVFFGLTKGARSVRNRENSRHIADDNERPIDNSEAERNKKWLPLFGWLMFLYVGTESAVGGWVASYALRAESSMPLAGLYAASLFWAMLLAGRCLAPILLRSIAAEKLTLLGMMIATFGVAQLLLYPTRTGIMTGIGLAGFGFAPIFPNTVAALAQTFGAAASRVISLVFAFASLGGAVLPWSVGFISNRFGSLRFGLIVAIVNCCLIIALQLILIYRRARL